MASFGSCTFDGVNGAVLYLQEKAQKTSRLVLSSGVVESVKESRALVVSLATGCGSGPDHTLGEAIRVVQEALDVWAVKGVMARTLAAVGDEHILWWEEVDGARACRIWFTIRLNPQFEARAEVRDRDGNLVPPRPEPVIEWHPSFRFFRLGQATTDLVDAFRNYYLALEGVLSTIEPVLLRPNGRPAEQESAWLSRALPKAATLVDLREYVAPGVGGNPIDAIRAEIYAGARTGTFHAKTGAAVLLPHDDATRTKLRDSVSRLRRLYLDLAQVALGFKFLGGGGLAPAGFQAMGSAFGSDRFYASSDPVDEGAVEDSRLPARIAYFDSMHVAELDDEYHVAYAGKLQVSEWNYGLIRQVGTLRDGSIAAYEDLEGELDVEDLDYVECVIALAVQDPRALGTRYLS